MTIAVRTTDHDEIRRWAEARGGRPAVVGETLVQNGGGLLRIAFGEPGGEDEGGLIAIPWEEFFRIFERNALAFLTQEDDDQRSRFHKFVDRD